MQACKETSETKLEEGRKRRENLFFGPVEKIGVQKKAAPPSKEILLCLVEEFDARICLRRDQGRNALLSRT